MKTHVILSKEFFPTVNRLSITKISALLVLILCFAISPAWGATPGAKLYVDDSAEGNNDGTNWSNAFTDLQDALAAAVSGDEIWVAAGTYKPTNNNDRSASFILKSGVKIYGGFAGDEGQLQKRQLDPSLTVLSGDIGTIGDDTDNSYHVVYADGVTDAVLDGFTVTRGRGGDVNSEGAGMYTNNSALTVANCIFSYNKVAVGTTSGTGTGIGGGMYNKNSAPIVTNCTFSDNQAGNAPYYKTGKGGGMYNEGYFETGFDSLGPVITGCTFSNNVASSMGDPQFGGGGGMYNHNCSPTIDRCTFTGNLAGLGGGMLNFVANPTITNCIFNTNSNSYSDGLGGAIYNISNAIILNSTFYQNGWRLMPANYPPPRFRPYTALGGAIYDMRAGSIITNCIFIKNAAKANGGAIYSNASRPHTTLTNSLFYENIKWWPGEGGPVTNHMAGANIDSINNLYDIDPLLVDPAGGDFHLRFDSPCIDAGYSLKQGNYLWPQLPDTDFEGDKRIFDGDGDTVPAVDIGVDEFVPNLPDLRAFLQVLADTGELDGTTAARLIAYVDAALLESDLKAVTAILKKLIADAEASLNNSETAQLIVRKTKAVIENLD